MVRNVVVLLLAALLAGCGEKPPEPVPQAEQSDVGAVPPDQLRAILEGLRSDQARMQYAALDALARFPTVAQKYREHIERLRQQGATAAVRQRAASLLKTLGP